MPTQIKARGNAWLARVTINGVEADSKIFPPGRRKGPEWMVARQWEIKRKEEILNAQKSKERTISGFALLLEWSEKYLAHVEQTMARKTFVEKKTVMKHFFSFCRDHSISGIDKITKPMLIEWLSFIRSVRGPDRANRYRKNLLAAWHWGIDAIEGFPQAYPAIQRIKPFPAESKDRYVPPEEDIIKVLRVAEGQDLVMLLAFCYTGARRGEVFRLTWEDVDFRAGRIRLADHKAGFGKRRVRWLPIHPTLADALRWWRDARPRAVDNVFMRIDNDSVMSQTFTERQKLLPVLCARAGVRFFGFHALRHKSASIVFMAGGLNAAQQLMGHYRATTTDIYVRSAGLYADNQALLDALGNSEIGMAANALFAKTPHELGTHEAYCKPKSVNS
ncbi:MAG: site-specific integrase [Desulfovibrio sp.]|nr:site-specific integrase [Desulfovibrio sp.]